MNKIDLKTLKERQGWTLAQKIDHSLGAIDQFLSRTNNQAYVSFSGGKDSTVLLDLCRIIKPDILGVYSNTGVEFPDINKFVRETENTLIIRPKQTFKQIIEEYGFPLVSKNVAEKLWYRRYEPNTKRAEIAFDDSSKFCVSKRWRYLDVEPYDVCKKCCEILKIKPFEDYEKSTQTFGIIGTMADESFTRQNAYIERGGCNSFVAGHTKSNPLSIWLQSDIWEYIKMRDLKLSEIYYKGAKRTGCAACGFGAFAKLDNRFDLLYEHYPKYYHWFMNLTNKGTTYRVALRKMLAVVGKYLPDERPKDLFSYIQ